ncbi:hypothetical protein YC2023_035201 [Brassica napus]
MGDVVSVFPSVTLKLHQLDVINECGIHPGLITHIWLLKLVKKEKASNNRISARKRKARGFHKNIAEEEKLTDPSTHILSYTYLFMTNFFRISISNQESLEYGKTFIRNISDYMMELQDCSVAFASASAALFSVRET